MSTKNLSEHNYIPRIDLRSKRVGIVTAQWNEEITFALRDGAIEALIKAGLPEDQIVLRYVPGSFELSLGAQFLAESREIDAVITLGCIIQGETRHFDFISTACANGITNVGLKYNKPVIFGVLTPDNLEQAQDRAGGKHGNKGVEAAITALKMLEFAR